MTQLGCAAQDPMEAPELGRQWQDALTDLCDAHFFFEQVRWRHLRVTGPHPVQDRVLHAGMTAASQMMLWHAGLQIQDMDQTRLDSLAAADDLAALEGHDFAADGLRPPLGPGNARLLAYRYREMRARYLTGMQTMLGHVRHRCCHGCHPPKYVCAFM